MNTLGIALLWCAVQVTLVSVLSGGVYLALRRLRPVAAAPAVFSGLAMVVVLSLCALSPWPRWTTDSRLLLSGEGQVMRATKLDNSQRSGATSGLSSSTETPAAKPAVMFETEHGAMSNAVDAGLGGNQSPAAAPFWQMLADEIANAHDSRLPAAAAAVMLAAMAAGLTWLVLGVVAVRWQRQRTRPVLDQELLELVEALRAELGCGRPVEVRQSDDLATAATIGWRRPLVMLPVDWTTWTVDQCRAILAHEIAHARSHDFLALLLGQLGLALHFYHPLVHWLMGRLRLEQEVAADAAAAGVSGGQRQYLTTIAELALRQHDRPLLWPARAFLPTQSTFLRRIAMLRNSKLPFDRPSRVVRWLTIGIVLSCAALVAGLRSPGSASLALADDQEQPAVRASGEGSANPPDVSNMPFEARLPSGITVQLLGVSENPSQGRPWWRPDGSPLPQRPYDAFKGRVFADESHVAREFAVLLHNLLSEPVGTRLEFRPAYSAAATGHPRLAPGYAGKLDAMAVSLPAQATVTVRFGVADGPWTTVRESNGNTGAVGTNKLSTVFSQAVEMGGSVAISVSHNINGPESRVIAIGKDGREYTASSVSGGGAGDFHQIMVAFSELSLRDVEKFCLQTRPYQWVEFRNVSLEPGKKTDVQIVASPEAETAARSAIHDGGFVLTYQIDSNSLPEGAATPDLDKLLDVVDRRLTAGRKEFARVGKLADGRITVTLAHDSDADKQRVERLLARPGTLEFRILASRQKDKAIVEQAFKNPSKQDVLDESGKKLAWWVPIKAGENRAFAGAHGHRSAHSHAGWP